MTDMTKPNSPNRLRAIAKERLMSAHHYRFEEVCEMADIWEAGIAENAKLKEELETYRERHRDAKSNFATIQRLREENAALRQQIELEAIISGLAQDENAALKRGIRNAMNNLGVPNAGYPSPVAEAWAILAALLTAEEEGG